MIRFARRLYMALMIVAAFALVAAPILVRGDESPFQPAHQAHPKIVRGIGTLEPFNSVEISAAVTGTVTKIMVDFNSRVREGDLLATIDDTTYRIDFEIAQAGCQRAEAELLLAQGKWDLARSQFDRAKALANNNGMAASELDTAAANIKSAEAGVAIAKATINQCRAVLEKAKLGLANTRINSPVSGMVLDRRVTVGQSVSPLGDAYNRSLFLIASDLTHMQVLVAIPETEVATIRPGQIARFKVSAFPKQTFEGKVSGVRFNATIAKESVKYMTVIDVANPNYTLLPYLTAEVEIETGNEADAPLKH